MLLEAFKLVFNTSQKIDTEKGIYNQFSVSSKADIQTVINFFSFSGLDPLIGLKGIQYYKWLISLRNSSRFSNLNIPPQTYILLLFFGICTNRIYSIKNRLLKAVMF